jgi:glucosamine-6-phosphate deaminase
MTTVFLDRNVRQSQARAARFIIDHLFDGNPLIIGGATGRTQRGIYECLFSMAHEREISFRNASALFLDEYVNGGYATYRLYAMQHLRAGKPEGFREENVYVPRGCFFENDRPVSSDRLSEILNESTGEWEAMSESGDDGAEIFIHPHATHPVLRAIRQCNLRYDEKLQTIGKERLQLLGIGRQGHLAFVEAGTARSDGDTMLVRLADTTCRDNDSDFNLRDGDDNEIKIASSRFAISQGIRSILSAGKLILSAHGASKCAAVKEMLLTPPSPQNPAGYVTTHPFASIFLDFDAWGDLNTAECRERGFHVVSFSDARSAESLCSE